MSKFNVGDKVYLLPSSRWVDDGSVDPYSANPLNVEGFIDEVDGYEYGIMWGNGQHNSCYTDDDLILAEDKQPEQDCPYRIIEELSAQVDNLEELVVEQAAHIRELQSDSQAQQADCYRRLHDLLISHRSFQESTECRSNELADTIKLLQLCYDSRYGN